MSENKKSFGYKTGKAHIALRQDGYYVWDLSTIKANGKYHMFASHWKENLGFGRNWLYNSEIVRWNCMITTNSSIVILSSGKTYMIYKSRCTFGKPLQFGIAVSDRPDGLFERLTDNPILELADPNKNIEDPFLWYDEKRKKFCMLAKDDSKNGSGELTDEWSAGFYAESDDCICFELAENPKAYLRIL